MPTRAQELVDELRQQINSLEFEKESLNARSADLAGANTRLRDRAENAERQVKEYGDTFKALNTATIVAMNKAGLPRVELPYIHQCAIEALDKLSEICAERAKAAKTMTLIPSDLKHKVRSIAWNLGVADVDSEGVSPLTYLMDLLTAIEKKAVEGQDIKAACKRLKDLL